MNNNPEIYAVNTQPDPVWFSIGTREMHSGPSLELNSDSYCLHLGRLSSWKANKPGDKKFKYGFDWVESQSETDFTNYWGPWPISQLIRVTTTLTGYRNTNLNLREATDWKVKFYFIPKVNEFNIKQEKTLLNSESHLLWAVLYGKRATSKIPKSFAEQPRCLGSMPVTQKSPKIYV